MREFKCLSVQKKTLSTMPGFEPRSFDCRSIIKFLLYFLAGNLKKFEIKKIYVLGCVFGFIKFFNKKLFFVYSLSFSNKKSNESKHTTKNIIILSMFLSTTILRTNNCAFNLIVYFYLNPDQISEEISKYNIMRSKDILCK